MVGSQTTHLGVNDGYGNHEGYSGGTIAIRDNDILTAIDTYTPEVVMLWFGAAEVATSTEDIDEYYTFAVDCLAKTSVTTVIVGTCPPCRSDNPNFAAQNAYRTVTNTHFTVTQAPLPTGMYHCDPGTPIDDSCFSDNVHLNDLGYSKTAPIWKAALAGAGIPLMQPYAGKNVGDVL